MLFKVRIGRVETGLSLEDFKRYVGTMGPGYEY